MEHETDYQRTRRQRQEVKKYGVTSSAPKETPGQQAANARVRKGTKRPEHGEWPIGKMNAKDKALNEAATGKKARKGKELESRSKKAGFYVHGHKNLGDVYEA